MKMILWMLCAALAVVFFACEPEILTDDPDPETPDTPTTSFYVKMSLMNKVYQDYSHLVLDSSSNNPIPKYGKVWLLDEKTGLIIYEQPMPFGSYRPRGVSRFFPHDSNYFYNPNDIFALFENGTFSALQTINQPYGMMENVPYGKYYLLASMGVYHQDTLKSYRGSILRVTIDSTFTADTTITLESMGYHSPAWLHVN